ncbi:MAG: hypothetical protein M1325_01825 [Actinobacteria bacterium]|nr:hypothetical protein [Actinomycetota bacterium]
MTYGVGTGPLRAGLLAVLLAGLLGARAFSEPRAPVPEAPSLVPVAANAWLDIPNPAVTLVANPGATATGSIRVTVRSNWPWRLVVSGIPAVVASTGPGGARVRLDTSRLLMSAGATRLTARAGGQLAAGGPTSGTAITITYRLSPRWSDDPGAFVAIQQYTLLLD